MGYKEIARERTAQRMKQTQRNIFVQMWNAYNNSHDVSEQVTIEQFAQMYNGRNKVKQEMQKQDRQEVAAT